MWDFGIRSAPRIAGVSLWKFLDELRKRNILLKYSLADAQSEIDKILARAKAKALWFYLLPGDNIQFFLGLICVSNQVNEIRL